MADIVVSKGDFGVAIPLLVVDHNGTAVDLTGYTVTCKVWAEGSSGSPIVETECTVDDEEAGSCHYTPADGDFDTAGDYLIELERTASGVQDSTTIYTLTVEDSA